MLFGCLSETVIKGELKSAIGLEEMKLGCVMYLPHISLCCCWCVVHCSLFSSGFDQPSCHWIPFMEAAVILIYQLAEGAEEICAHILQACSQQALEKLKEDDGQKAGEEKSWWRKSVAIVSSAVIGWPTVTTRGEQSWGAGGGVGMEGCECCEGLCEAWRRVIQWNFTVTDGGRGLGQHWTVVISLH